jgi:hypothetical protein
LPFDDTIFFPTVNADFSGSMSSAVMMLDFSRDRWSLQISPAKQAIFFAIIHVSFAPFDWALDLF